MAQTDTRTQAQQLAEQLHRLPEVLTRDGSARWVDDAVLIIEAALTAAKAEGAREERERIAREQLPITQPTRLDLGL